MFRFLISGFRRREDRWAVLVVALILLVSVTAIGAAVFLKLQMEWDASVAGEVRQYSGSVAQAFADAEKCLDFVDRTMPIDIKRAMTSVGTQLVMSLPGTSLKLGDTFAGPLLTGYLEIHGVRLANAMNAGKSTKGFDIYVGELLMDVRRRYTGTETLEAKSLGRVLVLSEKNIFNTYTVKGCRKHVSEDDRAQLCELTGGTYDRKGLRCLEGCPAKTVQLTSGLEYNLPKSTSGSVKQLVANGEVQMSAQCYR
ncbi:MAG: hypothetical protein NDI61_12795, partial [Bdellovibrionaceae bacterium]|nr:hypothetical protein [Pseudobdellovibrionaceae bacterium]